jgi:hypothetical protein
VKTVYQKQKIKIQCIDAPKVEPLKLRDITWLVVGLGDGTKGIGLSTDGYENLSYNTSLIYSQLKQQIAIKNYYRDCITEFNTGKGIK